MLEAVELESTQTRERRVVETSAVFSMIGAKPWTDWLPPQIERDEKGFIKTGHAVAPGAGIEGEQTSTGAPRNELPGYFCGRRCSLGIGEALRRCCR